MVPEVFTVALSPGLIPNSASSQFRSRYGKKIKDIHIHVAIAPTKNIDRLEWFVEKSVELGVDHISLLQCDHSERNKLNQERLVKKAISAMKQSLKYTLPAIHALQPFSSFVRSAKASLKFIAYVDEDISTHLKDSAPKDCDYLVLIGPEGDFSKKEIDLATAQGFKPVSLGKSRLRTETAGLAALHILNLIND